MECKVCYSKRAYYVNVFCFCHSVDAVQDGFGTADGKVEVVDHWGLVVSMSTPRALHGFAGRVERHRLTMPMAVSKPKRIPLKTNLDPKIRWHTTRADLAVAPLGIWWHLHRSVCTDSFAFLRRCCVLLCWVLHSWIVRCCLAKRNLVYKCFSVPYCNLYSCT